MLHNTVSGTILHGSDKINVIPSEVSVEIDGRLLPGYRPDDIIAELRQIVGNDVEFEVIRYDPESQESIVVSAWGEKADWYRNIQASPALEIRTG